MSVSARYTALLDACVLYPAPLRDLLLTLADHGLYHARWTRQIQDEWVRNLLANRSDLNPTGLARTCELMNTAIPDCLVENYQMFVAGLSLPDPDDRHVLAAAIVGHADAIVTFNLKDFPAASLSAYHIDAVHPDDFVSNQLELHAVKGLIAIKTLRARLRRPPQTPINFIDTIERSGLPMTALRLREVIALL